MPCGLHVEPSGRPFQGTYDGQAAIRSTSIGQGLVAGTAPLFHLGATQGWAAAKHMGWPNWFLEL